jgi:hypothetical protein
MIGSTSSAQVSAGRNPGQNNESRIFGGLRTSSETGGAELAPRTVCNEMWAECAAHVLVATEIRSLQNSEFISTFLINKKLFSVFYEGKCSSENDRAVRVASSLKLEQR